MSSTLEFIAAGGNRHPSAADWATGLLAFGAGNNIALWNTDSEQCDGIGALLAGHTDLVNAIKIVDNANERCIISGAADNTVRIWSQTVGPLGDFDRTTCLSEHKGSVNTVSALPDAGLFVSGSADGTVKIWTLSVSEPKLVQSISLQPRYLPLASSLALLANGAVVLAVSGTTNSIQIYVRSEPSTNFEIQATLTGHEGWIRSLDFVQEGTRAGSDLLLASASQDKYTRLWRFHKGAAGASSHSTDMTATAVKKSLSNKAHQVGHPSAKYAVTFEALLIGHEDWIYSARWGPSIGSDQAPTLLTASADNSLAIWVADESSGLWVCTTRLGEISSQKGSTTATGSTGGFWIGLWHPNAQSVASLGRTGSWRLWKHDVSKDMWIQDLGISGHTEVVQDISWAVDGSYLLSTGADQTTRFYAEWKRDGDCSWHEMTRPQIHGYDLNCIDSISPTQFISGANEKLLRVFNKPKAVDSLVAKLSGAEKSTNGELPDGANIPVLGLSNKAVTAVDEAALDSQAVNGTEDDRETPDPASVMSKSTLDLDKPPFEEHLARHTLWPEHEKLYGHGYEISAVAASHDGSLVATACKASSIDHAVVRLYTCKDWREVKPPLTAHSLTVTSLAFSQDDKFLLTVGRDRKWALFERDSSSPPLYSLKASDPKGHSRMILDCSFAPSDVGVVFATAGRDKSVKLWRLEGDKVDLQTTIATHCPVTVVAFDLVTSRSEVSVGIGLEDGNITIAHLELPSMQITTTWSVEQRMVPSKAITALRWRPALRRTERGATCERQLAASSEDFSVRIYSIA